MILIIKGDIAMNKNEVKGNVLLFITAVVWGFAFVAQRVGAQIIGSFSFNSIRFALGATALIPLMMRLHYKRSNLPIKSELKKAILPGVLLGSVLFVAASLQQIGLKYTTAGNAAFITGMYIILVPVMGIFFKHKLSLKTISSSFIALIGLYFLTVSESMAINIGDIYQLVGAVFWAIHILFIDYFVRKYDALKLSIFQFYTCALLSAIVAFSIETTTLHIVYEALIPILYGGLVSVGIGYTLQIVGQRHAKPSHAAIILSMEAIFGVVGGMLLLGEVLSSRGYLGIILMFAGMILSQINFKKKVIST